MSPAVSVWAQHLLPQQLLASLVYHISRSTWPALKNPLIRWFVKRYRVDLHDAERHEAKAYESFNAFFTRRLKPGARPIEGDNRSVISPVDGYLTQFGTARDGELIQR